MKLSDKLAALRITAIANCKLATLLSELEWLQQRRGDQLRGMMRYFSLQEAGGGIVQDVSAQTLVEEKYFPRVAGADGGRIKEAVLSDV